MLFLKKIFGFTNNNNNKIKTFLKSYNYGKKSNKGDNLTDRDINWKTLNKNLLQYSSNLEWGLYTNTILEMGEFLLEDKKIERALENFLEVCYLDLNGPTNSNLEKNKELLELYPMWNVSQGFLAPGVIYKIKKLSKKLNKNINDIKELFLIISNDNFKNLGLSLTPENAWKILEKEISN